MTTSMRACWSERRHELWQVQCQHLTLLLLMVLIAFGTDVSGEPHLTPPQQVIQQVSDGLRQVLEDDRERLRNDRSAVHRLVDDLFLPHIDLDRVAALTLGRYWRDATSAQRRAFTAAFKDLVVNSYAHAVDELGAWNIRHLPPRAGSHPDRVLVRTQIERPRGAPVAVDYRMIRKNNRWLAYDVLVEGVSLLTNYRSSFTGIARERGIDGLIQELRRRNGTWTDD